LNRSTAKQVEFWEKSGNQVAHSTMPADIPALMQGIAEVHIQIPASQPVSPEDVFSAVDEASSIGRPGQKITRDTLYYEASKNRHGLLDQVMPVGTHHARHFNNGSFLPE